MKVTNTERMKQLACSIQAGLRAIEHAIDSQNSAILDSQPWIRIGKTTTIRELIDSMEQTCLTIGGDSEDSKYYYADIELPYTQDSFPVEHR